MERSGKKLLTRVRPLQWQTKIVNDNYKYARLIKLIQVRQSLSEESIEALQEIFDDDEGLARQVLLPAFIRAEVLWRMWDGLGSWSGALLTASCFFGRCWRQARSPWGTTCPMSTCSTFRLLPNGSVQPFTASDPRHLAFILAVSACKIHSWHPASAQEKLAPKSIHLLAY
jgi:hypothetical protein